MTPNPGGQSPSKLRELPALRSCRLPPSPAVQGTQYQARLLGRRWPPDSIPPSAPRWAQRATAGLRGGREQGGDRGDVLLGHPVASLKDEDRDLLGWLRESQKWVRGDITGLSWARRLLVRPPVGLWVGGASSPHALGCRGSGFFKLETRIPQEETPGAPPAQNRAGPTKA